jgi:hypothetical protein
MGTAGMGWFADSTQHEPINTLTYGQLIDLSTATAPQLSFWQKALLDTSESLTVEVSVDGGITWQPVDQQAGFMADWSQHVVDLFPYRGFVIGLRFTFTASGTVSNGGPTVGYWLDELTIQDAPLVPTITPIPTDLPTVTPLPTETPTEIPTAAPLPTEVPTDIPQESGNSGS